MHIKILFILLIFSPNLLISQNIIKVRAQHQSKTIYKMRHEEELGYNESNIAAKQNGIDYEFKTYYKNSLFQHKKGRRSFKIIWYRNDFISSNYDSDLNETTFKLKRNKRVYGPYKSVNAFFNEDKKELYGFRYQKDGKTFIEKANRTILGPFDECVILETNSKNFIYKYKIGSEWHITINKNTFGPFQNVQLHTNFQRNFQLISFKEKNLWQVKHPIFDSIYFSEIPEVYFDDKDDSFTVKGNMKAENNTTYYINSKGNKKEFSSKNYFVINNQDDTLFLNSIGKSNYVFNATLNNELIGQFKIGLNLYMGDQVSDLFPVELRPSSSVNNQQYFIMSASNGLLGPFNTEDKYNYHFFGNNWAFFNKVDSTLMINGEPKQNNILAVDFTKAPKETWILKSGDKFAQPYKNNKKGKTSKMPYHFRYFNTPDKPFLKIFKDEKYYIRAAKSQKLLGPVFQSSHIVLAKDESNFAENSWRDGKILINGKVFGEGFNLIYNTEMNSFHWLSLENKKYLTLHSYEID